MARKGSRKVDLDEGQVIDSATFDDLYTHAKNSGMWYTTNFSKTAQQMREKFYEKGYPKGPIFIETSNGREERNIVEEIIEILENGLMIDDENYAIRFVKSRKGRGHGPTKIRQELMKRGVANDLIDEALYFEFDDTDEFPELDNMIEKELSLLKKRGVEGYALKQKITRKMVSRGWGFSVINESLERAFENSNEEEDYDF